jgi:hypothetical protein
MKIGFWEMKKIRFHDSEKYDSWKLENLTAARNLTKERYEKTKELIIDKLPGRERNLRYAIKKIDENINLVNQSKRVKNLKTYCIINFYKKGGKNIFQTQEFLLQTKNDKENFIKICNVQKQYFQTQLEAIEEDYRLFANGIEKTFYEMDEALSIKLFSKKNEGIKGRVEELAIEYGLVKNGENKHFTKIATKIHRQIIKEGLTNMKSGIKTTLNRLGYYAKEH